MHYSLSKNTFVILFTLIKNQLPKLKKKNKTPLNFAIERQCIEIIKLLVSKKQMLMQKTIFI